MKMTYTSEEVMSILHCSKSTLMNYKNRGVLQPIKGVKPMLYSVSTVQAFIDGDEEYSPLQYNSLKREFKRLQEENRRLKAKFLKVQNVITVEVGDLIENLP